jgi:hypothetical protein
MKQEIKLTFVFSFLVIFVATSALFAAEVSKKPFSGNAPASSATIQKLPNIIKIDKGLILATSPNKALPPSFYDGWKQMTDNYNPMPNKITAYEQEAKIFQKKFEECSNKNYTQSDQQNAGCADTDTIATCSTKLFNNCIKDEDNKFENIRKDLANTVKKLTEAADQMYYYFKY